MRVRYIAEELAKYVGNTSLVGSGEPFDSRPDSLSMLTQCNKSEIDRLNHKIEMLEQFLDIELTKEREKYQKKGKK